MRVTVTRTGGFASIPRSWQVSLEREPDMASWLTLLRDLPWDDIPRSAAQPDRYLYRIECEPYEPAVLGPHEAVIPEQDLKGPWRELVARVRERDEQYRLAARKL